jgi:hypothetical protein
MFWYNKKVRAITHLKGVVTPRIFGKGRKSIKLDTVVYRLVWAKLKTIASSAILDL